MDGSVVVKAKRQQRGRTRDGCATCRYVLCNIQEAPGTAHLTSSHRLRRVKCDELKPRCFKCTRANRLCEWEQVKGVKHILATDNDSYTRIQILPNLQRGSSLEQRGFDFFVKRTAPSLSGLFSNDFWGKDVLQAGYDLPSFRHAVVAIGAVHEQFVTGGGISGGDRDETFALQQYNKSVRALSQDMASGMCSTEIALICCALYISFDSLRGMTSSAVMHLHSGIKMLETLYTNNAPDSKPKIFGSLDDLRRLMSRLASQINSDMQDPSDEVNNREDTIEILADTFGRLLTMQPLEVATAFTSFEEARDHLYSFINGHLYHYYLRSLFYGSTTPSEKAHLEVPIHNLQAPILASLHSWSTAFNSFLADLRTRQGGILTAHDTSAASLLQMHYQISRILILGQIIPDEHGHTSLHTSDVFKPYSHDFGEALLLIESLIKPQADNNQDGVTHSDFYPDCGVVPMLFFIAMKSPDTRLRKKATSLLRLSHRREGTWDSETCLRIVEYNIAREEADTLAERHAASRNSSVSSSSTVFIGSDGRFVVNSPESDGTSPDSNIDFEVVLKDERARRYIEAGKEEAARLQRSMGINAKVNHSLLYL